MEQFSRGELVFDVGDRGPEDGEAVVLLHGFPETAAAWDGVVPALVEAGYRTLAPNQRGYSPGARPTGRRSYVPSELVGDVLALADAAGVERFHLVGHDFGANVAWTLAASHPERLRSLTAVSVGHPRAFVYAMTHSAQPLQSWYMFAVQIPGLPERVLLARDGWALRTILVRAGLADDVAARFVEHLRRPGALRAALDWYRALPLAASAPAGRVAVPTLYVWGANDGYVTPTAAYDTGRHVTGPYRFEVLEGATHWVPEHEADRLAPLVLTHLQAYGGG
ncbi:MAG: alpha/beta hydrolase [Actinobacteria bacterium]|nr:alpha/beta hydrolase [Actinomycetota bacterium]